MCYHVHAVEIKNFQPIRSTYCSCYMTYEAANPCQIIAHTPCFHRNCKPKSFTPLFVFLPCLGKCAKTLFPDSIFLSPSSQQEILYKGKFFTQEDGATSKWAIVRTNNQPPAALKSCVPFCRLLQPRIAHVERITFFSSSRGWKTGKRFPTVVELDVNWLKTLQREAQ